MRQELISQRLYSLDALRGLDMLMIMGLDSLFGRMAKASGSPFWDTIATQFRHPEWNGFHLYDLIFPLFIFLAGVAVPYSLGRLREKGIPRKDILIKVVKRGLILVILGVIYNNGLEIQPIAEIRFGSVLGRIGLAYMLSAIIYIYTKERGQVIWLSGLLIGYWLLLKFTSAPGFAAGDLTMEGNFTSYVDRLIMPGRLYEKIHDPEGLFSTIPAIGNGLLGILTGNLLRNRQDITPAKKALFMGICGIGLIILALIWNLDFPINKNLWTSSFVLLTGGISMLLLSVFYYIIDVRQYKSWAFFLKVIGMNSILIYISGHFINWKYTVEAFFLWVGQLAGDPYGPVLMAVCALVIKWLFLYILYRKKIFLRV